MNQEEGEEIHHTFHEKIKGKFLFATKNQPTLHTYLYYECHSKILLHTKTVYFESLLSCDHSIKSYNLNEEDETSTSICFSNQYYYVFKPYNFFLVKILEEIKISQFFKHTFCSPFSTRLR
jgi:hypothetical protein